jgi:hypothetical protein
MPAEPRGLASTVRGRAAMGALLALLVPPAALHAQEKAAIVRPGDIPAMVRAQADCDVEEGAYASRRRFAGGVVFALKCPGNNQNWIQTLVFATDDKGTNARSLRFPSVPGSSYADRATELSNIRWYPELRELSEIFVDPEDGDICRTERRWRLVGTPPQPQIIFMRETRDCDGKGGWRVVFDARAR